jgi:hypothetical protein
MSTPLKAKNKKKKRKKIVSPLASIPRIFVSTNSRKLLVWLEFFTEQPFLNLNKNSI